MYLLSPKPSLFIRYRLLGKGIKIKMANTYCMFTICQMHLLNRWYGCEGESVIQVKGSMKFYNAEEIKGLKKSRRKQLFSKTLKKNRKTKKDKKEGAITECLYSCHFKKKMCPKHSRNLTKISQGFNKDPKRKFLALGHHDKESVCQLFCLNFIFFLIHYFSALLFGIRG